MKQFFAAFLALTISITAMAGHGGEEKETKYKVDVSKSAITWKGKKVSGEHYGKLLFKEGHFTSHAGEILHGAFKTDMTSITCEDLNETFGAKLVRHLKSPDFFNVKEFPSASLEISSIQPEDDDRYTLEGFLTIKGITHPVVFPAQITMNATSLAARGELSFDRTLYDIKYGSGKFFENLGDNMINDEVAISFVIVAEAKK